MIPCERCGKLHDGSYGSGRFCSKFCAHSRIMTDTIKQHISDGMKHVDNSQYTTDICDLIQCQFCNKIFDTKIQCSAHKRYCKLNPNRDPVNKGALTNKNLKLLRLVKVKDYTTGNLVELDITYQELEDYKINHQCCEICGKLISELSKPGSKIQYKNLSIDHIHGENKFRCLLCNTCNRELGWYEHNKEKIESYLNKKI